ALAHAGRVKTLKKSKNMLIVTLNDIKVDFVNYTYPLIYPIVSVGNIRLASIQDIAAMKLNAIAGRGVKKDFIDVYYLLKQYTFKELIDFYLNKYPDGSEFIVRKSMVYFDDADSESTPIIFDGTGWEQVKEEIIKHVM
ncbi:MAG: nucleotidyl transferase AbiEii/AbiGii toxin family protein, partial [Bacteroidota bacterium]